MYLVHDLSFNSVRKASSRDIIEKTRIVWSHNEGVEDFDIGGRSLRKGVAYGESWAPVPVAWAGVEGLGPKWRGPLLLRWLRRVAEAWQLKTALKVTPEIQPTRPPTGFLWWDPTFNRQPQKKADSLWQIQVMTSIVPRIGINQESSRTMLVVGIPYSTAQTLAP